MLRKRSRPVTTTTTSSPAITRNQIGTATITTLHSVKSSKPTTTTAPPPLSLLYFNHHPTITASSNIFNTSPKTKVMSPDDDTATHTHHHYPYPIVSPSSVLDTSTLHHPASPLDRIIFPNPFVITPSSSPTKHQNSQQQHQHHSWDQSGISVALTDTSSKPKHTTTRNISITTNNNRLLSIQIPSRQPTTLFTSKSLPVSSSHPSSPVVEFGIKTPRSPFLDRSRSDVTGERMLSLTKRRSGDSIEEDEMEMESEDYTCVISRGPNPKTTHIFGDRVVECSACNNGTSMEWMKKGCAELEEASAGTCLDCISSSSSSDNEAAAVATGVGIGDASRRSFLSCCCLCKKGLGDGTDIYMYRGEKAFCSQQCRDQGMLLFDGIQT